MGKTLQQQEKGVIMIGSFPILLKWYKRCSLLYMQEKKKKPHQIVKIKVGFFSRILSDKHIDIMFRFFSEKQVHSDHFETDFFKKNDELKIEKSFHKSFFGTNVNYYCT